MSEGNGTGSDGAVRATVIPEGEETAGRTTAIATRPDEPMVMDVARSLPQAAAQFKAIRKYVDDVMEKGEDYGTVEGIAKPFLFKSGAEKLATLFGYAPVYVTLERIEDWAERKALGFFFYRYRCDLVSKKTGTVMGSGIGSCNSMEDRYRWIGGQRTCPNCSKAAIIKGRAEYGGGWLCFAKKGGCGSKWPDGEKAIEGQSVERVERETFSLVNTIDKMAQKRALVAATLIATGTSALFTQDEETVEAEQEKSADKAKTATVVSGATPARSPEAGALAKAAADAPFWREAAPIEVERMFVHPEDAHGKAKNKKNVELPKGCRWEKRVEDGIGKDGKPAKVDRWVAMIDAGLHGGDPTVAPHPAPAPAAATTPPVAEAAAPTVGEHVPTASGPVDLDTEIQRALNACGFGVAAVQVAARQMGVTDGDWRKLSPEKKEKWLSKLIDHAAARASA